MPQDPALQPSPRSRPLSSGFLVLCVIHLAKRPMSSYEIGLHVRDPERPISAVIKSLAKDRYLESAGAASDPHTRRPLRRAKLWALSAIGTARLARDPQLIERARVVIASMQVTEDDERYLTLLSTGPTPAAEIAKALGLTVARMRTATRRLELRRLIYRQVNHRIAASEEGLRLIRSLAPLP